MLTCDQGAKRKTPRRSCDGESEDPIIAFFTNYPGFHYEDDQGVVEEFYRMYDYFGWGKDDGERRAAHRAFKESMVLRFNDLYGTDTSKLDNWHKLCLAVNIEPLPQSVKECKRVCLNCSQVFAVVLTCSRK